MKDSKANFPNQKLGIIFIEDGSFTFDNRVIREAQALLANGWDITIVSPKYPGDPFYKKLNQKLRVYFYPKPVTQSLVGHLVESMVSILFGSILVFYASVRHGFSIFHACNPMDILWLVALPYKVIGKRFIFDQHDLVPELVLSRGPSRFARFIHKTVVLLEKCSFRLSDAVISTNESYKRVALIRGRRRPDEVFVVRNGPDLAKFRWVPPKEDLKKDAEVLVGYLGNMNPQDGVEYLLNAAEYIIKERAIKDIKFILIGGGGSQKKLSVSSRERGLEGLVVFTGRVPDQEMLSILSACDICVQPDPKNALNDVSTMNKALEYMALGKPVVAFELEETKVSCANAALYARPNDPVDLANRIMELANNKELRMTLSEIGRTRVESELAWKFSIPNLIKAYEYALKNSI